MPPRRKYRARLFAAKDRAWADDRPYLQQAAIAATWEPRLLKDPAAARGA